MHIEQYRDYCLSKPGVTESTPFPRLKNVLVFKVLDKMFTATDISTFASFSIKCVPETIDQLREEYSAMQDPSYFSKKHWSKVVMDDSISDKILMEWLDISYHLVISKMSKKVQKELSES